MKPCYIITPTPRRAWRKTAGRARAETFGIDIRYAVSDAVDLPAYAGSLNLRFGRPQPSAQPGGEP